MTLTETPRWMTTTTSTSRTRTVTVDASASVRVSEEPPRSARANRRASKRQKSEDASADHASSSSSSASVVVAGGGGCALRGVVYAWEFDDQNHSVCVTSSAGLRFRVRAPSALAPSCALTRGDDDDSSSSRFVCATEDGSCVISIAIGDSHDLLLDAENAAVVVHVGRAPLGVISRVAALGSCGASGVVLGGTNGHGVVVHALTLATMCELKEGTLSRVWSGIKGEVGQAIVDVTPRSTPLGGKELVTTLRADGFVQVWDVTAALQGAIKGSSTHGESGARMCVASPSRAWNAEPSARAVGARAGVRARAQGVPFERRRVLASGADRGGSARLGPGRRDAGVIHRQARVVGVCVIDRTLQGRDEGAGAD